MTDIRREYADTLNEIIQLETKLAKLKAKAFRLELELEKEENDE